MNAISKCILETYSCLYFRPIEYKKPLPKKKVRKVEPVPGKGGKIDVRI